MKDPILKPRHPAPSDDDPQANQLDRAGGRRRVLRVWQTAWLARVCKHVQFMQFGDAGLRPLIWLHSVEYPMAPAWGFCVDASERGYSVISIRRPGFGETSPVGDTDEEVSLLIAFLEEAELDNAVLIVEGTARPAGLRLALESGRIGFTLLVRPYYVTGEPRHVSPWIRDLVRQTILSRAGASLSLAALRQAVRQAGIDWLFEKIQADGRDLDFLRSSHRDVAESWDCFNAISVDTFRRDLRALAPDPSLTPGLLSGLRGLALTGGGLPEVWRNQFRMKSASLGIEAAFLPEGNFFSAYSNGQALLEFIAERA